MVYPDRRYLERDPNGGGNTFLLDTLKEIWVGYGIGISESEFFRRMGLINKLLDNYRDNGDIVNWMVFSEEGNLGVADVENIHPIYRIESSDNVVPVGVTYRELNMQSKYPDERSLLGKMDLDGSVICGGFHSSDCVPRFNIAARNLGLDSNVDPLLTDRWFYSVVESFGQDLYAYQIKNGFLDPVMHEDDPNEEKLLIFGNRLDSDDLLLRP